jgi:hypothetical protein
VKSRSIVLLNDEISQFFLAKIFGYLTLGFSCILKIPFFIVFREQ